MDLLLGTVQAVGGSREFLKRLRTKGPIRFEQVCPAAQAFVVACVTEHFRSRSCWVICPDSRRQEEIFNGLLNWKIEALFFPELELPTVEGAVPDPEVVAERLDVLRRAAESKRHVVVLTAESLDDQVPAGDELERRTVVLRRGERLSRDELVDQLLRGGYEAVPQVNARGQFAVRGGILDVFSWQHALPVRIELFGDEIDSLREFDLDEQTSIQKLERCEILTGEHERSAHEPGPAAGDTKTVDKVPMPRVRGYIQPGDLVISLERAISEAGWSETDFSPSGRTESAPIRAKARATTLIEICSGAFEPGGVEDYATAFFGSAFEAFEAGDFLVEEHKRERALDQLRDWTASDWTLLAVCHNDGEIERLRDVFTDNEVDVDRIQFVVGNLNHGFTYPAARLAVLSDAEIFGRYQTPSARRLALRRSRLRGGRVPIDFADLDEGGLVVHVEHGIARYNGIQRLHVPAAEGGMESTTWSVAEPTKRFPPFVNGPEQEVVVLEFANDARLYVPFEQAYLISRYVGVGKRYPPLSSLGDGRWSKAKRAAENAVFDYAAKLLSVQAERHTLTGFAFPPDVKWQREFEGSFLYKETPDQLRAIQDTKLDMESNRPMDRLICGDVGFGKTEVAIRAAFKAVMSGKQVAMLVPTTVLAQQHQQTFRERMSDYPIRIEMLSRFLSPGAQRAVLEGVKNGSVDIVVGTHRLISADVVFKDLGLVVIDEEQRFGVRHKERFKERFKLVDVLTLSATPIPRTLYLSLVGAKDMSIIETPPPNRLPIETTICGYDERIIRDAIRRELRRKGQVYLLHNRVQSIGYIRERILSLCPEAQVDVGHGQLDEEELELVMKRFVDGETDVLISTTIVESGLDIPNANTIIIDRADRFGLADLYQLRGRVGRAQHKAYAYLMLPRELITVGAARRRISAIKQYSGLGAGFKIAMRDLEIRGAGNILGTAQSGHIVNIGFDLYCQLLHQAVERLKGKRAKATLEPVIRLDFIATNEAEFVTGANGQAPAFIPADYIAQPQMRIQAYKKLAEITTREQLRKLGTEWRDRFGALAPAVENLLLLAEIKIAAARAKVSRVEVKTGKVMLTRGGDFILVGDRFPRLTSSNAENNLRELFTLLSRLS
jgi:transcription-repair coupling factor (superfamily II helicase)